MRPNFRRRLLSLAAAALCLAGGGASSWAQPLPGALPTGWSVTSGNVSFQQNGSTLNILQGTPQALVNFATFNVGANALVDIRQPGSTSALLARTTGGDPSLIYGQIKANGGLWLINPAGIMVGPGARIDVGSFIASTLNVSDSDFLAGRLTFRGAATAGEVRNAGTINAASGGSIYLVGPSVVNSGTLNAPHGEVLLAAGQTVQLVDTGTPGVSVAVTGTPGEVKNLGRIAAEAGRIGIAAGLVTNSGSINADSVVREGGRVFLRASSDLKTTATSDISANGTSGGNVVLYADNAAVIDGRVSATGSAGRGGYVDTSGRRSLDVVNAPVVGRGGEWHIDPGNIEIVAGDGSTGTEGSVGVIVSTSAGAKIGANVIKTQLDNGTDVTITTGPDGNEPGDITVSSAIAKTGAIDSALTLNASNRIVINAAITSANSKLDLNLNSNRQNDDSGASHAATLNADLNLRGGVLTVTESQTPGMGTLDITGGTTSLTDASSAIVARTVNLGAGGTLSVNRDGAPISGTLNSAGTVNVDGGALTLTGAQLGGQVRVAGGAQLTLNGANLDGGVDFSGAGAMTWQSGINLLGAVDLKATAPVLSMGGSTLLLASGPGSMLTTRNVVNVASTELQLGGGTTWNNLGTLNLGNNATFVPGGGRLVNGGLVVKTGIGFVAVPLTNSAGGTVRIEQGTLDARMDIDNPNSGAIVLQAGATLGSGGADIHNNGSISGSGTVALGGGLLVNNGIVSPGTASTAGTLTVGGNYVQTGGGTLNIKVGGGGFDLLDIDGSAQLAGTLNLGGLGGVLPAKGATADFIVARGPNSTGTFDRVNAPVQTSPDTTATLTVSYAAGGTSVARSTAALAPSLGACTTNPALPGCEAVLPTLAQCVANGALAGCAAVLPTAAVCAVSPTLLGCPAPVQTATPAPTPALPPSADICTIAPNSALCQVLSPPTASEPTRPVQTATNEIIKTVTSVVPPSGGPSSPTEPNVNSTAPASPPSTNDKTADKKDDKKDDATKVASASDPGKSQQPSKKMYCN